LKTVLFAWELGRGLGHLVSIQRMARRLKAHGMRTIAVVNALSSIGVLNGVCDDVVAAPAWPLASQDTAQRARQSSATLNDILSSAGLADASAVQRLLVAWDAIFERFCPHLVIADFSPLAALAARGRIPLVQVGNGYTLPPDDMMRFPPLHRMSPPQWREDETLSTVNEAARSLGRLRLDRLPQLFSGDTRLVQTFAVLDPYDTQRVERVDGPMIDPAPVARRADAHTIFVYLSGGYSVPPNLVGALAPFAGQVRIHAPALSFAQRDDLTRFGARIDSEPVPLRDVLASARLVVHSGGSDVASEALAAGVPQLVLSGQIEQTLNGRALQQAGVGTLIETYDPSASISTDVIAALCNDDALATRAADAGQLHRQYLSDENPALKCERACLGLLGIDVAGGALK
jgi:UDP:flavonoid glycosyltransferase YjiC (YdhE family)